MEYDFFIWNLYRVVVSNHQEYIMVCALSFNGAIERVNSLIENWETKQQHSIISITYVSPCVH